MSDDSVKEAFKQVREGKSPEYVICDALLGTRFLAKARRLGVKGSDSAINTLLINLRKKKKLKDCPTTLRKKPDPKRSQYTNAVLNTVRVLERQFRKNADDIICDPATRAQFDAMIQFLSPGTRAFEAQYAALSLRKASRLKPEPVGQVIRAVASEVLTLSELEKGIDQVPSGPGVYIFFDESDTLYAGKADSLRRRIKEHISTWLFRDLVRQMKNGGRSPVFVVYHELDVSISAAELTAYETEIIRSRDPQHNRAGRIWG